MGAVDSLSVDGMDLTPYIADGGIDFESNDIDAANSGRDKDGTMRRLKVARKAKLKVTLRTLPHESLAPILRALGPQEVAVTYLDPMSGWRTSFFYCSSYTTGTLQARDGVTLRKGATFSLVEV